MDDTDKVRELPRRRPRARTRGRCSRTSTRRNIASSRLTRGRSGTGSAASKARESSRSRPSSPRARPAGPSSTCSISAARVDKRLVNRRVVESLVRAGAFDAIDSRRATLFASVGVALSEAERAESAASQVSLFAEDTQTASLPLVLAREWTRANASIHEKAALGYYLSGHPI